MIRTELGYRQTLQRIEQSEQAFRDEEQRLQARGLTAPQAKRALEPSRVFYEQLLSEVRAYERMKRGEFDELQTLAGLGRLLIAARIASGLSQRELAERLGVHESQVSRDERTDYAGVTVERAGRILDALGVQTTTRAQLAGALARSA
jgi:ribosome-binding protein aMBF1 (putative translation factor)